jgi:hypothetical protein
MEVTDNFFIGADQIAPEGSQTPVIENERSWGEAFDDVAGNTLAAIANGGNVLQVAASGLNAGLNTGTFQEQKNRRIRAAKLADLQLEQQQIANDTAKFKLQQSEKFAPLDLRAKELSVQSQEHSLDQKRKLAPGVLTEQQQTLERNRLVLQQSYIQQAVERQKKNAEIFKEQFGYNGLNVFGRAQIDNSQYFKAFTEFSTIAQIFKENPEAAKAVAADMGFNTSENEKGELVFTSADGKNSFTPNSPQLKDILQGLQKSLMDDIVAANVTGKDAATMQEASLKATLNTPETLQIFGSAGNAYRSYSSFINSRITDRQGNTRDRFTNTQKAEHILSSSLKAALLDNKLSQEEIAVLTPQFAATVKQFGGEVKFGKGIEDTVVIIGTRFGNKREVPLRQFAQDIAQRDVISAEWYNHQLEVYAQMQRNAKGGGASLFGGGNGESGDEDREKNIQDKVKLRRAYGDDFSNLSEENQKKLIELKTDIESETKQFLKMTNVDSIKQLSLKDLRILDKAWGSNLKEEKLDSDVFYSPFQDEIFKRELTELKKEKAPLIKEIEKLEEQGVDKIGDVQSFANWGGKGERSRQTDTRVKELRTLRRKVDEINDGIKMRETKLKKRGIEIKESK